MLDELGNLQSEGHGISGFQTMLSIGLGQEQQFTLILQTLQQLRDVYGDSVDKIVQGNTSNIVFLKSTDDSMLDTLQKMSGTTHKSFIDSKTVTTDKQRLFMQNESKLSYTMTTKEVPVIMYNDMAFIAERNSIVFRAGDPPVWNRNQMILPMSWRLFQNTIVHAGHDYSLQTIPTLSSALEFDVRQNQPNFKEMLNHRMRQAYYAEDVMMSYQQAYGYSDFEISQLDPDTWASEIMSVIDAKIAQEDARNRGETDFDENDFEEGDWMNGVPVLDNTEQLQANQTVVAQQQDAEKHRYAGKYLSREDLVSRLNGINHSLDKDIITAYVAVKGDMWADTQYFSSKKDGSLYSTTGTPYIISKVSSESLNALNEAAKDADSRVFAESGIDKKDISSLGSYQVTDDFYRFLCSFEQWTFAKGRFEQKMAQLLSN